MATLLSVPTLNGISNLVTRETVRASEAKNWARARGILYWSIYFGLIYSLCAFVFTATIIWVASPQENAMALSTLMACTLLPVLALMGTSTGALRGHFHPTLAVLPEMVIWPALTIVFLSFFMLAGNALDPQNAMLLQIFSCVLGSFLSFILLLARIPAEVKAERNREIRARRWLRLAFPFAAVAGLIIINRQISLVMLGLLGSEQEVGIYRISMQGSILVTFGVQATALVFSPYFAQSHLDHRALLRLCMLLSLGVALPTLMILVVFGDFLIFMVFGDQYAAAFTPMIILSFANIVIAISGSVVSLLNMRGHQSEVVRIFFIAMVINAALNLAAISFFGANGAALATTCAIVIWSFLLRRTVMKRLSIDPIRALFSLPTRL